MARSTYEYENYGKKQKGQYSFNPILEWTSAEVWLYIYLNDIFINKAYTKGNSRAGCLLCPMSGGCSDYFRHYNYSEKIDKFVEIIQSMNGWDSNNLEDLHTYITSGGWENRRSGRGIKDNYQKYKERTADGKVEIELIDPSSDWREWLKTANTDIIYYKPWRMRTELYPNMPLISRV